MFHNPRSNKEMSSKIEMISGYGQMAHILISRNKLTYKLWEQTSVYVYATIKFM